MDKETTLYVAAELNTGDIAQALVENFMPEEILSFVKYLDAQVADEDFTLALAKWARGEEDEILADRADCGDLAGEIETIIREPLS